ncbi:MAG: hypothetical protein JXA73_18100 [Acidobacteria bacterium]|nr:hypothetical protein [Acidobacteriota bacterium]
MLKGVHLTVMIGPAVAVPVSQPIVDALTDAQITCASDGRSGFQLTFRISTRSSLHTLFLLSGGAAIPLVRVILVATVNGTPEVLIDGVVTNHQVSPGSDAGHAALTLTGEDLSCVMNYIDFSGLPYPAMPAEAQVLLILSKYAVLGIIPKVIPSPLIDLPLPIDRIPVQSGKDLDYVKKLAEDVGYVFYVEPGSAPGISFAYWGPQLKIGTPQPALNVDMDAHTNVESMNFIFDADSKKLPIVFIQNPIAKVPIPIPVPDITPLSPPLGLVPPIPKGVDLITGTAKYSPIRGALLGMALSAKSAQAVTASGSLDVARYGRILQPRKLVGVRGAGTAFDGLYYVSSVTHSIKPGEYKQNFTLVRNGLISTVDKVPA